MKAIQVLFVRRNDDVRDAGGQVRIVEGLVPIEIRFPVCFLQRDGQREVGLRNVPDDDILWRRLEENVVVSVIFAIRSMHDKLPSTLRLELKYLECVAETVWSPPGSELIGIGKCSQDLCGREWEDAV